ncbi:MAG: hydroxysqualene dehydroxylase HpnE [Hydrogenophaga sp.]|nr:hydroxysqualene dehydroxylase HpnE [Hydrogenophaga sp.]
MNIVVVGAGWAGMAAAVQAARRGHAVTVFEATRQLGGRARGLPLTRPDGRALALDNGQHILIGAYTETLALMRSVGVPLDQALLDMPLGLPYPDGLGLQTPEWAARWPAPLDALVAIATARGWRWSDRIALMRQSLAWRREGFACDAKATVAQVCVSLPPVVMRDLIEPLCVSALNLPAAQASGAVFLRVLRDALFGQGFEGRPPAHLLLPRQDLSALFPAPAARWLTQQGHRIVTGTRVTALSPGADGRGWSLTLASGGEDLEHLADAVIWATGPEVAADALAPTAPAWSARTAVLQHTAIATVYAWAPGVRLSHPMLALRPGPDGPAMSAQFVFDRGQLKPDDPSLTGLLAFVVSASPDEREALERAVMAQGASQLGLHQLQPVRTVIERRATFACTPGLQRPPAFIAPGLVAAGDYVDGPYPATLEGAVRSGLMALSTLEGASGAPAGTP